MGVDPTENNLTEEIVKAWHLVIQAEAVCLAIVISQAGLTPEDVPVPNFDLISDREQMATWLDSVRNKRLEVESRINQATADPLVGEVDLIRQDLGRLESRLYRLWKDL